MRGLTEEQADLIAGHPDVVELGRSIVLGLAENQQLTGQSVEIRWANDAYAQHSYAAPTTGPDAPCGGRDRAGYQHPGPAGHTP